MRRTWNEALMSIGFLAALIATLAALDDRVRLQLVEFGRNPASNDLIYGTSRVRDFMWMLFQIARDQSHTHAVLMMFAVAGLVLTIFMLRT
jgi:hypothetical protein